MAVAVAVGGGFFAFVDVFNTCSKDGRQPSRAGAMELHVAAAF